MLIAVLVPLALLRFLDGDEGVYAYAAHLAVDGRLPYRDFFYEQMPLLPYVYGAWTALAGESWYAVRLLSALFALASGVLLYALATRRLGDSRYGLAAVVCYAGSALVFGYFTIVKTFALATFLLLVAYTLAERGRGSRSAYHDSPAIAVQAP